MIAWTRWCFIISTEDVWCLPGILRFRSSCVKATNYSPKPCLSPSCPRHPSPDYTESSDAGNHLFFNSFNRFCLSIKCLWHFNAKEIRMQGIKRALQRSTLIIEGENRYVMSFAFSWLVTSVSWKTINTISASGYRAESLQQVALWKQKREENIWRLTFTSCGANEELWVI